MPNYTISLTVICDNQGQAYELLDKFIRVTDDATDEFIKGSMDFDMPGFPGNIQPNDPKLAPGSDPQTDLVLHCINDIIEDIAKSLEELDRENNKLAEMFN